MRIATVLLVIILELVIALSRINLLLDPKVLQENVMCLLANSFQITSQVDGLNCFQDVPLNSVCSWQHVTCDSNANINAISFEGDDRAGLVLSRGLISEIGLLTNLEILSFYNININGTIPTEIGSLYHLTVLHLAKCSLFGAIPSELSSLQRLVSLDLQDNSFTGTIPSSLGLLNSLIGLRLYRNILRGEIPDEMYNLSALETLDVAYNELSGTISSHINRLSSLLRFRLYINMFTGTLPSEIGQLANLTWLVAESNQFHGTIPSTIGNLTGMQILHLSRAYLSDIIPTEIGLLTQLFDLDVSANKLSGSVPTEIGLLTRLSSLDVSGNIFTGSVPSSFCRLQSLNSLFVCIYDRIGCPQLLGVPDCLDGLDITTKQFGSLPYYSNTNYSLSIAPTYAKSSSTDDTNDIDRYLLIIALSSSGVFISIVFLVIFNIPRCPNTPILQVVSRNEELSAIGEDEEVEELSEYESHNDSSMTTRSSGTQSFLQVSV